MLKVGDRVRLKAIPPWVGELPENTQNAYTKKVFARCLGGVFTVYGVGTNTDPEGLTNDAELRVIEGQDDPQLDNPHPQSIWIEPEYLEIVEASG
jgi:hypothetical protein